MQVSSVNNVKIYNLSHGKSLPEVNRVCLCCSRRLGNRVNTVKDSKACDVNLYDSMIQKQTLYLSFSASLITPVKMRAHTTNSFSAIILV